MADPKHLKVQPLGGSGESDPLAELTRIMGMNTPSAALRDARPDDFGIDLERELLGDFGANDSRPPEPAPVRATAPQAPARSFVPQSNDSWKAAFSDLVPVGQPQASQPQAAPAAEPPVLRRDATDQRAPAAAPAPAAPAAGAADEDPFERLAAFSRRWLDRDAATDGGRPAGAGFRMPDQPAGPVSPVPSGDRPARAPIPVLRPAAAPASATISPRSSLPDPVPSSAAAPSPAPAQTAAPERAIAPEPAAAPEDKIFDPFAELVAMAGHARSAPVAPPVPAPAAAAGPASAGPARPSPVPARAPAAGAPDAGLHNQAFVANPSIIARRTNWQSVSGAAPRDLPTASVAAPIAAAATGVSAEPVAEAATRPAAPADAVSGSPVPEPRAADVPQVRQEEPAAAAVPDPTWDAISAWVSRPNDPNVPFEGALGEERDDLDDFFFPKDAAAASVLPPVARIPELSPDASDQEEFADFGDDFDLESLLRSELEGEGLRSGMARAADGGREPVSVAAQSAPAASRPETPAPVEAREAPVTKPSVGDPVAAMPAGDGEQPAGGRDDGGMPEVDTVEVPTAKYVVADEIDLPELAVEEELPPPVAADDIDADFGGGFEDRAETRPAAGPDGAAAVAAAAEGWSRVSPRRADAEDPRGDVVDDLDAAFDEAVRSWADAENEKGLEADRTAGPAWLAMRPDARVADDDDGFDPEYQPVPAPPQEPRPAQRSRGFVVAALVAGVAVVGGIGAFALSLGGGGDGEPVLVRADPEPVKIKPEQPGGATVPNQDKAVYERFSSAEGAAQPSQEKLLSTQEEPVNLAVRTVPITAPTPLIDPTEAETADELPGAFGQGEDAAALKSEDRIEQADEIDTALAGEVAVVTPRRVRTMVVRPDGTLVPREELEPEPEAESVVSAIAEPDADAEAETEAPAPLAQAPIRTTEPAPPAAATTAPEPVAEPAAVQQPPVRRVETSTITREQATPARGPVAPARPVEQPVDIVGNAGGAAQGTQVAAVQPAPVAASQSSEWAMQIASQPTPEGAQASYADLSRRFGSVLNGRGVNIVKAEIAGKGTFWRVRIPTGSRADANALCERYKAAGGSCFVSK